MKKLLLLLTLGALVVSPLAALNTQAAPARTHALHKPQARAQKAAKAHKRLKKLNQRIHRLKAKRQHLRSLKR